MKGISGWWSSHHPTRSELPSSDILYKMDCKSCVITSVPSPECTYLWGKTGNGSTFRTFAVGQRPPWISLANSSSLGESLLGRFALRWDPLAMFFPTSTYASDVSPHSSSSSSCFWSFLISRRSRSFSFSFPFSSRLSDAAKAARRMAGGMEERSSWVGMMEGRRGISDPIHLSRSTRSAPWLSRSLVSSALLPLRVTSRDQVLSDSRCWSASAGSLGLHQVCGPPLLAFTMTAPLPWAVRERVGGNMSVTEG